MKVINLHSGPCVGKSSIAAEIFSKLKKVGINCELVTEFAKDLVWEESFKSMENQIYIFANQHHKLWSIKDKVDVAVVDSPLLNSLVYLKDKNQPFEDLILHEFNKYENFNFVLKRETEYQPIGRVHSLEEAIELDKIVIDTLNKYHIPYLELGLNEAVEKIINLIIR